MSIALLEFTIVRDLEKRGMVCHRHSNGILRIEDEHRIVDISLLNLYTEIVQSPEQKTFLIQQFVERICEQLEMKPDVRDVIKQNLYPRLLPYVSNKPISHPWTQSFMGTHLEFALVVHREGRLQFLSPMQVISVQGGLLEAKRQALNNIYTLVEQVDVVSIAENTWRVHHPEVLTSSLLLLLDTLLPFRTSETIQFSVPNRGTIWFSTTTLIPYTHDIQQEYQLGSHPISSSIFESTVEVIRRFRQSWEAQ